MSERWWVGKGPNGGYVAAVILRAIQASASAERAPRSLTVHYQRAPLAGPVEIAVEVEREGGRATFLSARMTQEGKVQATAQAVLSENWSEGGFSELTMPDAGEPGELHTIDPEPGRPAEHAAELPRPPRPRRAGLLRRRPPHRRLDPHPRAAPARRAAGGGLPRHLVPGALRPPRAPGRGADDRLHRPLPLAAAAAGRHAEDPYLVSFRSNIARHGFFEEDGELWSADGILLAQSRQLALLLDAS